MNHNINQENSILVSIAIPFYNAEKYLSQAINSVINQTYTNWILFLVDDGSKDSSLNIAKDFEKKDERIKVFSDGQNKNLGFRLNEIPSLVNTKYLARMDADDIMHPNRIEKQVEVLESHPEIDVLGTNAYSIDENNKVIGIRMAYENEEVVNVQHFIHPTIIAKTDWFRQNPYDVDAVRLEDAELWYRTHKDNVFRVLTSPLLFYREFSGEYYKKYLKGYKTVFYLNKKYGFKRPFLSWIFTTPLTAMIYFFYEKILISAQLNNRRNSILFDKKLDYKKYINEIF